MYLDVTQHTLAPGLGSIIDTIVSCIVIHNFEESSINMYHNALVSCIFFFPKDTIDTIIINICTE